MVEDPFLEYDAEGVRRAETGGGSVFRGGRDAFLLFLGGVASLGQLAVERLDVDDEFCWRREFLVPEGEGSAGGRCLIGGEREDAVEVFCSVVP